jgi:CheY-like chemotaxis protein
LAIVNSIVKTSSVDGSIDVSSTEGVGTEIRITFTAEVVSQTDIASELGPFTFDNLPRAPIVALVGFDLSHRGYELLFHVLANYLESWGIAVKPNVSEADLIVVNEDTTLITDAINQRDPSRPFVILAENRGGSALSSVVSDYERIGGFARVVYKPGGPSRLRGAVKLCLHALKMTARSRATSVVDTDSEASGSRIVVHPLSQEVVNAVASAGLPRRNSDDASKVVVPKRPSLGPRALTALATAPSWDDESTSMANSEETSPTPPSVDATPRAEVPHPTSAPRPNRPEPSPPAPTTSDSSGSSAGSTPSTNVASSASSLTSAPSATQIEPETSTSIGPTIAVGPNGTLLQSSISSQRVPERNFRVLIVEDNAILRGLLIKWLTAKVCTAHECRHKTQYLSYHQQYEHAYAVDGQDGVRVFESGGPFDVVLLDMSMPLLDGVGATIAIRAIEERRSQGTAEKVHDRARILALTGMSSVDDKDRAFKAGVDG